MEFAQSESIPALADKYSMFGRNLFEEDRPNNNTSISRHCRATSEQQNQTISVPEFRLMIVIEKNEENCQICESKYHQTQFFVGFSIR